MKKSLYIVSVILLCAAAGALFLYSTPCGVGLTNDSAAYIGGARSLLEGRGYVRIGGDGLPRAITHFPPFYALVLASFSRLSGLDPLDGAKWVNFCCAILNQLLFMSVLLVLTKSRLTAFLGGITFLCAGPVLQGNVYGLSEALYETIFLTVLLLSVYAAKTRKAVFWPVIGILTGALVLTRYAGLAAAGACAVFILCVLPTVRERIEGFFYYLAGFGLLFGAWLILGSREGESAVNRVFTLHLPAASKVEEGIRNFAGFFLPEFGGIVEKPLKFWGVVIALALLALLAAVVYVGLRGFFHPSGALAESALFAPALHGAAYMVMLLITACFIDGSTLFDNRILMPFYVCIMLLINAFAARFLTRGGFSRVAAVAAMLLFSLLLFEDELDLIREFHRDGQGFAGQYWQESETRLAALELPANRLLFSNRQTALSLLNDQPSYIIPTMFDQASFSERETFELDRQWMQKEALNGNAWVIVFSYQELMENEEDRLWLNTVLEGIPLYKEYNDGAIFGLPGDRK